MGTTLSGYNRSRTYSNVPRRRTRKFESVAEIVGAPVGKSWYHCSITESEAEKRLKQVAERNGNYLVYDFPKAGTVCGNYVLLVFYEGTTRQWKISRRQDGRYILGEDLQDQGVQVDQISYDSVKQLIKAHRGLTGKPLRLDDGETVTLTRDYVVRDPDLQFSGQQRQ